MATYTSNLNLKLPEYSEKADINDINENFRKIDGAINKTNAVTGITIGDQTYQPNEQGVVDLPKMGGGAEIDDTAPSAEKVYSSQKTQVALNQLSQQKANKAGWTANKIIGTDANGNMVVKDAPEGGADPLTIYPVGSIYMSVNETSPASLFGGTWEQLKDRFLLGAGGSYAAGSTGGESAHKLTTSEMPNHVHDRLAANGDGNYQIAYGVGDAVVTQAGRINLTPGNGAYPLSVAAQGGDQAHNNMPPYLAVYMWKRVA